MKKKVYGLTCFAFVMQVGLAIAIDLNPLDMRWTFGAHEPYTMYRRIGRRSTGGVDGNAEWVKPWLNWWDDESPKLMKDLGLNWIHSRFYKGMGWKIESEDFPNVKKFVSNCHSNGVHVLAYVQFSTLYPELMKREVPNVEDWAQINADGRPNFYGKNYFRLMPCILCREWESYLKRICTIALTEGGFDGVMFDNAYVMPCYCKRCQESFSAYLQSLPNREDRFGFSDVGDVRLPYVRHEDSMFRDEVRDPVVQAWITWRTKTFIDLFKRLREHVKSVRSDAVLAANSQPLRRNFSAPWYAVDMMELVDVLDIVIGQSANYPACANGRVVSRIRDLKLAREKGAVLVSLCDSDAKLTPEQEAHYLLPLYEDLVFGGVPTDRTVLSPKAVPGFIDKEKYSLRREKLTALNAFVDGHRAEFMAPVYQPVRLFYPVKEVQLSFAASMGLCAAEEIMTRRHIPWGYMISTPERPFDVPAGAQVIVVANQLALSQEQVDGLIGWAHGGGRLVITGDSGRYNGYNAQRLVNPLLEKVKGLVNVVCRENADIVTPAELEWKMDVGVSDDHGDRLLEDLSRTGFRLPFSFFGVPETVAVDVRNIQNGLAFHFVNYNPSSSITSAGVQLDGGEQIKIGEFEEYGLGVWSK